jgi:hypothetical protein
VNQEPDAGDDENHHGRERIEAEHEVDHEIAGRYPRIQRLIEDALLGGQTRKLRYRDRRDTERHEHHEAGQASRDRFRQPTAERRVHDEPDERQYRNQR